MGEEVYEAGTVLSILISLALYLTCRREAGIFVGLWVPTTILLLGELLADEDRSPRRRRV